MYEKPLIDTFLEMVRINSESRSEGRMNKYVRGRLGSFAAEIIEDGTAEKIGGESGNLVINIKGNRPGAPTILMNAHMDTVKPGLDIEPVIEGDMIRSAGETILGADDKTGLSVILETIRILKEEGRPHGDIQLVITVAEEQGLLGARNLDKSLLKADFGISLDCSGTAGMIYNASPFHDTIHATFKGRSAHAGIEPENGVSAILVASRAISKMKLGRVDEETTANVGIIKGGLATNIIPESVRLDAEARSHNEEKLKAQLADMRAAMVQAAEEAGAKVDIVEEREYTGYLISEDAPVIELMKKAASAVGITPEIKASGGGSDANIINRHGIPTIPIGSAMRKCHTQDEHIFIPELVKVLEWVLAAMEIAAK